MSVINKMLRDLDARRLEGATPALSRPPAAGVMLGTASVRGPSGVRRIRPWLWAVLLLAMLAALAWYGRDALVASSIVSEGGKPAPPPLAVASAPAASDPTQESVAGLELALTREPPAVPAAAAATVEPDDLDARARTAQAEPAEPAEPAVAVPAPAATAAAPVIQPQREAAAKPTRAERPAVRPPAISTPGVAKREAPPPLAAPLQQRRQAAVQETLAQAQSLWLAGSREAALALMQDAVALAEGAYRGDSSRREPMLSLAALVREQARMELALGRPGAVLALLTRLEPALAEHGDLWAMRGNAAQRLARHEEAVLAYRSALQQRPDESRWMLGAAVSLAALGRLEEAAALAERARAQGAVSPEVLTYLRQSGVPLR